MQSMLIVCNEPGQYFLICTLPKGMMVVELFSIVCKRAQLLTILL